MEKFLLEDLKIGNAFRPFRLLICMKIQFHFNFFPVLAGINPVSQGEG